MNRQPRQKAIYSQGQGRHSQWHTQLGKVGGILNEWVGQVSIEWVTQKDIINSPVPPGKEGR